MSTFLKYRLTHHGVAGGSFFLRGGFTLIELLASIAIISALLGLLLPSLSRARRMGQATKCMNNMRQIAVATVMYASDNGGFFPRTMETVSGPLPTTISWWAIDNYQGALNPYIQTEKGGVETDGMSRGKNSVWFDPADPDASIAAMWGSFLDNGLITGVERLDTRIPKPSETIYSTLRSRNWDRVTGVSVPSPLPVDDTSHPFWTSVYFDMCLDPWSFTEDEADPFHWSRGRVVPPVTLFPNHPNVGYWDQVIDGQNIALEPRTGRYGNRMPFSFCDGHVEMLRFEDTYRDEQSNLWDLH